MAAALAFGTPGAAYAQPLGTAGPGVSAAEAAVESPYFFDELGYGQFDLDYDDRDMSLSGRLMRHDPDGGPDVPVAGATVDMFQQYRDGSGEGSPDRDVNVVLATVTTDAKGRFGAYAMRITARDTLDYEYPPGDFTIRMFAARRIDPAGGAVPSNWDTTVRYADTPGRASKIRMGAKFTKGPTVGTHRTVTAAGVVERQDYPVWRPVKGITLGLEFNYEDRIDWLRSSVVSRADGSWERTLTIVDDGDFLVRPSSYPFFGDPFLDLTSVEWDGVSVGIPDHMSLTSGPYALGADRVVTASYTLNGYGDCDVEGQPVALQWSADGRTGWKQIASTRAGIGGKASARVTGAGDGYYRWYHAADDFCAQDIGYVKPLRRTVTRVQSFDAGPEPVAKGGKLTVSGVLQHRPAGQDWTTFGGGTVEVWLRDTTGHWTRAGVVTADSRGRFTKTVTASKDGSWRAVYIGDTATHYATWGPLDYVDVR